MDLYYLLGFSYFLGIGPVRLKKMIEAVGSLKKAYFLPENDLALLLGDKLGKNFTAFREHFDPVKKLEELKAENINILDWNNKEYPQQLKTIADNPICLYIKGDIKKTAINNNICFSIVGTRKPSSYGQYVASKISSELVNSGLMLVSGMAAGIDSVVHQTVIKQGGKTIAVLGCGVDLIYPSLNRKIYEDIVRGYGLVISEVPPGRMVNKGLFVARNRIISGISQGILVIEGLKNSGTLITARQAAEQGKDVYAIPSPITSPLSEAPNVLIKQGAKLVSSSQDILEDFGLGESTSKKSINTNSVFDYILEIIKNEPKCPDEISKISRQTINKILQDLSIMEIDGVVVRLNDGKYQALA